ncbi:MAG: tetratricopeptide repeat protein [Gemmatimonadota bacterium]|nr:tetratricopeptide repeat protein [Gemmatimonadota bacterium]
MDPECTRRPRAIVTTTLIASLFAMAQTHGEAQEVEYPAGFDEEARYYSEALGPLTRPITTNSMRAQQFFDQGVQMMYAFTPLRAARSFRQAQREDPDCAMCYWGEAWAWGPYLNGPMGPDDAPRAYENIRKAKDLAEDHANDVERALIDAMAIRYTQEHDNDERKMLDSLYSRAMADVYEHFPHDLDVGTLYGESLMLLEPRRGRWDIGKPAVMKIHRILEAVLAMDIAHPGACHLYVHATEPTIKPEKAEACADYLGASIPGASHIQHMPSHTYNRVGRWGDAVRSNLAAWHSDQRAEEDVAWAIYPSHNLHMLLFAASMDGQGAVAMQAARDYGKIVPGGAFYEAMTMLRFGRFDEILELDDPPTGGIQRGFWDFARGYAYLRNDEPGRASVYLERVRRAAEKTPDGERFRGHSAADLLGVVSGILEGEILRHEGETDRAIEVLEAAIAREDGLRYDEPEPLNFSARHWLGDLLLELERYPEAERVFRAALEDHPMNGWSLFGLEAALRAQGLDSKAAEIRELFQSAWARSDTWITGPIF